MLAAMMLDQMKVIVVIPLLMQVGLMHEYMVIVRTYALILLGLIMLLMLMLRTQIVTMVMVILAMVMSSEGFIHK